MYKLLNINDGIEVPIVSLFQFFHRFESFLNFKNESGEEDIRVVDKTIALRFTVFPPHPPGKRVDKTMTIWFSTISGLFFQGFIYILAFSSPL